MHLINSVSQLKFIKIFNLLDCQDNVRYEQKAAHIFFQNDISTLVLLVPTGLMMKSYRLVAKKGWGNIINPAGHSASEADSI